MKTTLTVTCISLISVWQAICRLSRDRLRRLSTLRSGSLRSALTALLLASLASLAALHAADSPQKSNIALNAADDANAGQFQKQFKGPVKVFILAGQSNMEGQGSVDHDYERDSNGGKGNLVWSMKHSKSAEKMKRLKNEKGEWAVRDDVQISFKVGDKVLKSATSTCETCGGMANSGCFVRGITG